MNVEGVVECVCMCVTMYVSVCLRVSVCECMHVCEYVCVHLEGRWQCVLDVWRREGVVDCGEG